ncbi:MAG: hypothetical protein IKP88_20955 [Lachnospiraceae bacterium]|nr:hypothetical protein [Lachnospiraceae bacterium]
MTSEILLQSVQSYSDLIGTEYNFHIGRAGKLIKFSITILKEDCHHLLGLQHLSDRPERRKRTTVFDELLSSKNYRHNIASSTLWTTELETRVLCVKLLGNIIEDNNTIIRYNSKLNNYSKITAEYLLINKNYQLTNNLFSDIYLFVDKRSEEAGNMFCKSIFTKSVYDYAAGQENWTLLYKTKTSSNGITTVLYQRLNYNPEYQ